MDREIWPNRSWTFSEILEDPPCHNIIRIPHVWKHTIFNIIKAIKGPVLANIYLFKVRRRSGVFIVNFEHTSHLFLVFLLLTLSK